MHAMHLTGAGTNDMRATELPPSPATETEGGRENKEGLDTRTTERERFCRASSSAEPALRL